MEGININQHVLAPYACDPLKSRGRRYKEEESSTRSAFRRDCDRIIHSAAFRRLEYKTQVFVNHEGDHYRTRLTHSLEVAQIARSLCRNLRLSEDLGETLALAHDLGHTPFGHAGEDALSEARGKKFGPFNHNAQTVKILTKLEHKYAGFRGLNLTWETLEGIAKHNGPLAGKHAVSSLPQVIAEYDAEHNLDLESHASAEAQIAALADDIAYNNHDIDDGLRAGLFTLEELRQVPLVAEIYDVVAGRYPKAETYTTVHEMNRLLIHRMISDLALQTIANIEDNRIETVDDIRRLGKPLVTFSDSMQAQQKQIKSFLMERMYRHYRVCRMTSKAKRVLKELFALFMAEPECLPDGWREQAMSGSEQAKAEVVTDFIAGMTDRFAMDEYDRLFNMQRRV